jgi:hypothetical protein
MGNNENTDDIYAYDRNNDLNKHDLKRHFVIQKPGKNSTPCPYLTYDEDTETPKCMVSGDTQLPPSIKLCIVYYDTCPIHKSTLEKVMADVEAMDEYFKDRDVWREEWRKTHGHK